MPNQLKSLLFISQKCFFLIIFLLICTLSVVCTHKTYQRIYPTLSDGRYDSEFPYKNASEDIEKMINSICKIYTSVDYTTYYFTKDAKMSILKLENDSWLSQSNFNNSFSKSVSGTGTVLASDESQVVLLTCAHVVSFPDTIINFYEKETIMDTSFIKSITIKLRERSYIRELNEGSVLETIYADKITDIAFIGTHPITKTNIPAIQILKGKSSQLEWGNFVYIIGFPLGNRMITKAIVSKTNREDGVFLLDAMFNKGFSGGLVIAIRDGVPNFEWVGIARSVSSSNEYILKPEKDYYDHTYNVDAPYQGDIYIKLKEDINYGITHVIPSDQILNLYKKQIQIFTNKGYYIKALE